MESPERTDGGMSVSGWRSLELSKQFGESGTTAAGQTHSPKKSEKICKDRSGKDVLYPVILTWAPLNTQAYTHVQTHFLVNFQRTPAGAWHTNVINFSVPKKSNNCLYAGSLPNRVLLPFSSFLSFLLDNLIRPASGPFVVQPTLDASCLILHWEEVTLC